MDFISIPATTTIVVIGIYKLFELFVCKKERLRMLERCDNISMGKQPLPSYGLGNFNMSYAALRWGALFMGIGLGLLIAYFINFNCYFNVINSTSNKWSVWSGQEMVYGSCVLLFGGLGLITAFIIEVKLRNSKKED